MKKHNEIRRVVFRFVNLAKIQAVFLTLFISAAFPVRAQFIINPIYDASVLSSPDVAGITNGFNTAVQFFQNTYRDPITVNIYVDWGAAAGSPFAGDPTLTGPNAAGGVSLFNPVNTIYTYAQVTNALNA